MKKLNISILAFVCAICVAFGTMMLANVNTVSADAVAGATPTLSVTKVMISNSKDKMLLATAIKDYDDIYEIGYEFTNEVETVSAETKQYYTSISNGTTTLTAGDIFGAEFEDAGLIIWEINFEFSTKYEFNAYALVGARENGQLVIPATEVKVTSEVASRAHYIVANTDIDLGTASATARAATESLTLPANFDGYTVKSAKIASKDATAEITNEGAKLDVTVDGLPRGENKLSVVLEKDSASAIVEFDLTVADIVVKNNDDLARMHTSFQSGTDVQVDGAWVPRYYVFDADVDFGGERWLPGFSNSPKSCYGIVDGRGHTLANYYSQYGLCKILQPGAEIKNLHLKPIIRTNTSKVGGVCLENKGTIDNCFVDVSITDAERTVQVAGVAVNNELGVIKNCIVTISSFVSTTSANWIGLVNMSAITLATQGNESNCYAINKIPNEENLSVNDMYGDSVKTGLYTDSETFFAEVTSLAKADGWNSYWSIVNGELLFNGVKVL